MTEKSPSPQTSNSSIPIPTNLWQSKFLALKFLEQGLSLDAISREDKIPLAFAQEGLWFLDQLQPGNPTYNESAAFKIKGALNVKALQQSLQEIQRRHESLRTAFVLVDGQPTQVVRDSQPFELQIVETLHRDERETQISQFLIAQAQKPFDLAQGQPWRAALLQLEKDEYILSIVIHHIVTDRWSEGLVLRELSALYPAFCVGQPSPLADPKLQYAEFATWQRQQLQGDRLKSQLDYWKQQLGGNLPTLQLPSDRPRPLTSTHRGGKQSIQISSHLTAALKALGREVEVDATLYMTLLAAFQTLLLRYTGQDDLIIGTPVAGRNRPEFESIMGYFVNTIVLRAQLHGNPSFKELLGRTRASALGAFAYENTPFEQLVEELQPNRNAGQNPLFQTMFALQNTPMPHLELSGLDVTRLRFDNGLAKFDLTLELEETPTGLQGYFEYNTDLFDPATMKRMATNFQVLLEGIAADPEQPILALPLLSEAEKQQLLVEWNPPALVSQQTYHHLFEAQVERTPDTVAVQHRQQQLTYRELNAKANQLAHYLRSRGVTPDTFVGICLERSVEMAIAVLGIFKAGGAYLPLDPSYPQERLEYMLADSQASLLLTQARLLESLPNSAAQVVCLDTHWEKIAQESDANPDSHTTPENLAYIIYTSGSTGKPKGVMIPHRGLVSHNLATIELFDLTERDRALQFASISFDIAVEEIFPTWLSGATLVFRAQEQVPTVEEFLSFVEAQKLTILNLPTAFWHEVVKGMELSQYSLPNSVRLVIVGGEKASKSLYEKWEQMVGTQCRWLNSYGPTETTVSATSYDPAAAPESHRDLTEIPIGRPLSNTTLYILDEELNPVPVGVPGELYIGGTGVARGYLNRPDLTAERFIANPFSDDPEGKLYKTGDLVRYLRDGHVEFLGRIDFQVKIRGFRIELGEIEAALETHPVVHQAVVTAREDSPGQKYLAAYLLADLAVDRVQWQSPCQIELSDGQTIEVLTTDLAQEGLGLAQVPADWQVGQSLCCGLSLPGERHSLWLDGIILWRSRDFYSGALCERAGVSLQTTTEQKQYLQQQIINLAKTQGYQSVDLRRNSPRITWHSSSTIELAPGHCLEVRTENISRGGICLLSDSLLWRDGELLTLSLQLPIAQQQLKLQGRVIWHRGLQIGIQWQKTTAESEQLLEQHIEYLIGTQKLSTSYLRDFLKEKLPNYMIPSAFVLLDNFLMTPSGKVDRRALPAPEIDRSPSEDFVPPRDETESKLQKTWEKLLGIDKIGITENFFDLGGHSLIAVRLFAEIEKEFNKKLPLAMLFESPTIAQLAERLRPARQAATWDSLVTIKAGGSGLPVFLVHDADGETILYRTLANYLDPAHPVYGLRPYGREGFPFLQTRMTEMVDYYIKKIRSVQPHGPYLLGGFCTGGFLAAEIARKLQSQGEAIAAVVLMDTAYWGTPIKQSESSVRFNRFSQAMANGGQLKPHQKLAYLLKTVATKAKNLLLYEWVTKPDSALYKLKVKLLRYSLDLKLPLLPLLRNIPVRTIYMLAEDEYGPQEPFDGEVLLLLSTVGEGNDAPAIQVYDDSLLGWGAQATQGVKTHQIPGGHSSMLQDPHVRVMAEHLQAYINAATAVPTPPVSTQKSGSA